MIYRRAVFAYYSTRNSCLLFFVLPHSHVTSNDLAWSIALRIYITSSGAVIP